MTISDLHTFFIYVFFGYFFIFPVVLICLRVFNIKHPKQRMSFYLLALAAPLAGFALYHTVLTKRCQTGAVSAGMFWQLFDVFCRLGNSAIRFLGPVLLLMIAVGVIKAVAGSIYLMRIRARGVTPEIRKLSRVSAIMVERCRQWQMKIPEVIFSQRTGFAAFAAGLFRPVVVISLPILDELTDQELEGILVHELVHIRRRDTVSGWVLYLVRDLMFFSPFSTVLLDRYLLERERLCDRETVVSLGSTRMYASTLLKVWRLLLDGRQFRPHISAGFTGKKRDLELRVMSLLDNNENKQALPNVLFLTLLFSVATVTILYLGLIC